MKQTIFSKCLFASFLLVSALQPVLVFAQDPGPGPDVPIDGGLSLLVAAGVGYGVKKVREERKKQRSRKEQ